MNHHHKISGLLALLALSLALPGACGRYTASGPTEDGGTDGTVNPLCGNGVVDEGETCDTDLFLGEPGACPVGCDDAEPCTVDTITGSDCQATCTHTEITERVDGDDCCPPGADRLTDSDCSSICGNGTLEEGEGCDTGIAPGSPGACPTDAGCADQDPCTQDFVDGGGTCDATCDHAPVTAIGPVDACCPSGADPDTDADCPAACGDGIVSAGEACDTGIAAGQPGACPVAADCSDGIACTDDVLTGAGSCQAICSNPAITTPVNGDGCCPSGATIANDDDCAVACGDGVVSAGEACDTAIAAGQTGACPTAADCVDGVACTRDVLTGAGTCQATCTNPPIITIGPADTCCPVGGNANTDPDCTPTCGNGAVESGESCDTAIPAGQAGSCPTSATCPDAVACTADVLTGEGTCNATCSHPPITLPVDNDGCCPTGATAANDNDCSDACGDGAVTGTETCDSAIPTGQTGACPVLADCVDTDPCTENNLVSGGTCNAACANPPITTIGLADGCCPSGANANNDVDCPAVCGDGVLSAAAGETCDTAIPGGTPGACPVLADCVDTDPCTTDTVANGGTCTAACVNAPITAPQNGDGCCPTGATIGNDDDCLAACGDGVVTAAAGETCDIAIPSGSAGACPVLADCPDTDPCTTDGLVGGGTCTASCSHTPITTIGAADSCCPPGGNAGNDPDCAAVCGNGVPEAGEGCDDGNLLDGDGCSATCQVEIVPTVFRISTLSLRDPHAYTRVLGIFCTDITNNLNTEFSTAITTDGDGDGLLDMSLVALFRPLDQAQATNPLEIRFPDCTEPMATTSCAPGVDPPTMSTAHNQTAGTCLTPYAGTTRPYSPGVTLPTAPCYASDPSLLTIVIGGIAIPLRDAQVGATYVGSPATNQVNGLIMGFLSQAEAQSVILPADLPVVGGQNLAAVLRGGPGNCASGDDRDLGLDGTTLGWWLYLNFTADEVTWTGP